MVTHLVRRGVDVDCDSCMLASNSADEHKFHHLEVDCLLAQKQLQTRLHDASTCTVEPHRNADTPLFHKADRFFDPTST